MPPSSSAQLAKPETHRHLQFSFSGTTVPAVVYRIEDTADNTDDAIITIEVTPVAPTATPDQAETTPGVPVTVPVLDNDTPGDPAVPLDPSGTPQTSITVPDQGVWVVDPTSGGITFTPEADFIDMTQTLDYIVADENGSETGQPSMSP